MIVRAIVSFCNPFKRLYAETSRPTCVVPSHGNPLGMLLEFGALR